MAINMEGEKKYVAVVTDPIGGATTFSFKTRYTDIASVYQLRYSYDICLRIPLTLQSACIAPMWSYSEQNQTDVDG